MKNVHFVLCGQRIRPNTHMEINLVRCGVSCMNSSVLSGRTTPRTTFGIVDINSKRNMEKIK